MSSNIPRYVVKFENQEAEFSALEILNLYRTKKINFSTLIHPIASEEFRRFDQEPEFETLLFPLFRQRRHDLDGSFQLVSSNIIIIILLFLLCRDFFIYRLIISAFGLFIYSFISTGTTDCYLTSEERRSPWHFIPILNCYLGYRTLKAKSIRFNALFWGALDLVYIGGLFLPYTQLGNIIFFASIVVMIITWALFMLPYYLKLRVDFKRFKTENPLTKSILRCKKPRPKWSKSKITMENHKKFFGWLSTRILILILAGGVYFSLFWGAGVLRFELLGLKAPSEIDIKSLIHTIKSRRNALETNLHFLSVDELQKEREFWVNEESKIAPIYAQYLLQQKFDIIEEAKREQKIYPIFVVIKADFFRNALNVEELYELDYFDSQELLREHTNRYRIQLLSIDLSFATLVEYVGELSSFHRAMCRLAVGAIDLKLHGQANLPKDPFSSQPLKQIANDKLYSLGPNLKDDGGTERYDKKHATADITFSIKKPN